MRHGCLAIGMMPRRAERASRSGAAHLTSDETAAVKAPGVSLAALLESGVDWEITNLGSDSGFDWLITAVDDKLDAPRLLSDPHSVRIR